MYSIFSGIGEVVGYISLEVNLAPLPGSPGQNLSHGLPL